MPKLRISGAIPLLSHVLLWLAEGVIVALLTIVFLRDSSLTFFHLKNTVPRERCGVSAYRGLRYTPKLGNNSRFLRFVFFLGGGRFYSVDRTSSAY